MNSVTDDSINTEELLQQLNEAEELATLNSVTKEDARKRLSTQMG